MTQYNEKILNLESGETTFRKYTTDEIAAVEAAAAQAEADRLAAEQAEADRIAARAELLARLGITADEAKLLLG